MRQTFILPNEPHILYEIAQNMRLRVNPNISRSFVWCISLFLA